MKKVYTRKPRPWRAQHCGGPALCDLPVCDRFERALESDCRTAGFLIAPRGWERVSDVSNVVFTNGAIADDDGKVYIYYAASDTRLHVASTTIGQLLDFAFKNPADPLRSRDCVAQRVALIEKIRHISISKTGNIVCPWPRRGCPPWRNLAAHAGAAGFAGGGCQRRRTVPGAVGRVADPARCG